MTPSASFLLLLLLGLSQTQSLQEEGSDEEEQQDAVDITDGILNANNATDEMLLEGDLLAPKTRNAMKCFSQTCKWKKSSNGKVVVPYVMSRDFSRSESQLIEKAMKGFHGKTCIRFVPRGNQRDYISFENLRGCFSSLGRVGRGQTVSLSRQGCVFYGIIQHELNHALGFNHEQTRSDRDKYVRINWQNISKRVAYNFDKKDTNNLNTPYDYSSIMHYGRTAFSVGRGKYTITPIPNANVQIGQRSKMSPMDIKRINTLYRC